MPNYTSTPTYGTGGSGGLNTTAVAPITPFGPTAPPATPYPVPPIGTPKYFKPPKASPYPAQDPSGQPIVPYPGAPQVPSPGAFPNPQVTTPELYNPYATKKPALPSFNPIQYGKKPKAPFQSPATYQGPAGDVLPVPTNAKGKIKDKYISDFEKELAFAYRPGQFAANAPQTAYERGQYDPNSPNYFGTANAFSPEYNQQLLSLVERPLTEQRDTAVRGLSERFANLGRVGAGRFGRGAIDIQGKFGNALSDAVTRIALQQALGQRSERLLGEERGYQSAETERNRRFESSNRALDRRLQRQVAGASAGGGTGAGGLAAAIGSGGGGTDWMKTLFGF